MGCVVYNQFWNLQCESTGIRTKDLPFSIYYEFLPDYINLSVDTFHSPDSASAAYGRNFEHILYFSDFCSNLRFIFSSGIGGRSSGLGNLQFSQILFFERGKLRQQPEWISSAAVVRQVVQKIAQFCCWWRNILHILLTFMQNFCKKPTAPGVPR